MPCGSRTLAATPDNESVIWVRSFDRLETVLVCLAGMPLVGYCRQSLTESSIRPMGRVRHRSNRSEDKSTYRGQPVYPNSCPPTPESDVVLARVNTWTRASSKRSDFSSRHVPILATAPTDDPVSDISSGMQTVVG